MTTEFICSAGAEVHEIKRCTIDDSRFLDYYNHNPRLNSRILIG